MELEESIQRILGLSDEEIILNDNILLTLKESNFYINDFEKKYVYCLSLLRKYSKNDNISLEDLLIKNDLDLFLSKINDYDILRLYINKKITYLDSEVESLVLLSKDFYKSMK